jgi:DNA processing protein
LSSGNKSFRFCFSHQHSVSSHEINLYRKKMNSTNPEHIPYYLAAIRLPDIGPARINRWLAIFSDLKNVFTATTNDWRAAGITPSEIAALQNPDWKGVERDLAWGRIAGNTIITIEDAGYPDLLREIHNAPLVLFLQGRKEALALPQLAIVGTRNPTMDGKECAEEFAFVLAQAGLAITSGLAAGIDAASHRGALRAKATTIAVTGAGLDFIYPKSNSKLAAEIRAQGAIISEFPPDIPPVAHHFPRRNRIISGLSLGVLVVEATIRSGSLITARFALEQNREVFAIPGSIHNVLTRGCHQLIRSGAKLVEKAEDVLEEISQLYLCPLMSPIQKEDTYSPPPSIDWVKKEDIYSLSSSAGWVERSDSQQIPTLTTRQTSPQPRKFPAANLPQHDQKSAELLLQIGHAVTPLDTLIVRSGLTASEVSSMLLRLELHGYVQSVSGGYVLSSPSETGQSIDNN